MPKIDIENITSEEAIYLMKITINSKLTLDDINTETITQSLLEYRAINKAYSTLLSNANSGEENLMKGIIGNE